MNFRNTWIGLAGLAASVAASATTVVVDAGSYMLSYDDSTVLGSLSSSTNGPGNSVSFTWSFPDSGVGVGATTTLSTVTYTMPTYTISAKAGFNLSGPVVGTLGNLSFSDVGSNASSATLTGNLSINGGGLIGFVDPLTKTTTLTLPAVGSFPGSNSGFLSTSPSLPLGGFTTFAFDGTLILDASGGDGSSVIFAQSQNVFRVSFNATAVPVPAAIWLFGSALVGVAIRRRPVA